MKNFVDLLVAPKVTTVLDPNSKQARRDQFKPPETPVFVRCLHCGEQYMSDKMFFGTKAEIMTWKGAPLWFCPTEYCDGAGYGFDIKDVKES